MTDIVLVAINANYIHPPFGLFCLRSALGPLKARSRILEFTGKTPVEVVEAAIVAEAPRVVGFSLYLWNRATLVALATRLRTLLPGTTLVAGGPEVTATTVSVLENTFDHTIEGPGEETFRALCERLLGREPDHGPPGNPYDEYSDHDLHHRLTYVEASRGCAFRCAFCTSASHPGVEDLPLPSFLPALEQLLDRGARRIKFLDRSFNLDIERACTILDFFLSRKEIRLPQLEPSREFFVHFELVPERLPPKLKDRLVQFPPGTLRLEVGVQTLDPAVAATIGRPLNPPVVLENLAFLAQQTTAMVHADLIAGLPGESLQGFARGVDALWSVLGSRPGTEIQLGILKRLPGTPLDAAPPPQALFRTEAPYDLLRAPELDEATLVLLNHTARLWERIVNRGRFPGAVADLLETGEGTFLRFLEFARWFVARHGRSWGIDLHEVGRTLQDYLAGSEPPV